ncbi:MAG: SBBP repeat-containing protein [Bryobacteraceae bacterium]
MDRRRALAALSMACASGLIAAGTPGKDAIKQSLAQIPLSFERNAGQIAGQIEDGSSGWVARGNGYSLAIGATGATVMLPAPNKEAIGMRFLGARADAAGQPLEPMPGKISYLLGADPKHWIQGLDTYGRIEYRDVYEGIDAAWYGKQGQIEYDFVVRPGAHPNRIRMRVQGALHVALTEDGDVDIRTAAGALTLRLPQIYQQNGVARRRVAGHYVLESANTIAFALAAYDKTRPLVIDPTLVYGSFLPGGFDVAAVTTDSAGNIYVAGSANAGIPTLDAYQSGDINYAENCFVMKLNPSATTLLYATYVGGFTQYSLIEGIAVDSAGELVATGTTATPDFPLVNPSWSTFDTANGQSAIIFKLKAAGNALVYSTFMSSVFNYAVALDASGDAYVVGDTYATGVPTPGAWQTTYGGGFNDAFVAKLTAAGALKYFTFLGGPGYDQGTGIAIDSQGYAYVAGYTDTVTFPNTPPGARTTNAGGYDAFVAKISPDGTAVPWLTFFGGSGDETLPSLVRDATTGILYIAGSTTSKDLPTTTGVIQPSANGPQQGFVASVKPNGESFGFATYFGGRKVDSITTLAEPASGQLAIAGTSSSFNLASLKAIQPAFVGNGYSFVKSTNSGGAWTPADTGLPSLVVALSPDPESGSTMLALSISPFEVYRTTNGGATWTAAELAHSRWFWSGMATLARGVSSPETVYAYVPFSEGPPPNDFVYRSTDGGVTWTPVANPPIASTDFLEGLAVSPTDANTIVEVYYSGAVYQSTDGGASFTALASLQQSSPCGPAWVGPVAGSPDGSIYVGTYSGICKSTNGGASWSVLPATNGFAYPVFAIAVSPSTPSTLYTLGYNGTVYASTNGGNTWTTSSASGGAPLDLLAVAPSNPQTVYAAQGTGVYVSTNGAATWAPAASLPFGAYSIAVNATHPAAVYAGGLSSTDGFAAKLNTAGTSLIWSTFYTGSGGMYPYSVTSAGSGDIWMVGTATGSPDLPITANAYSRENAPASQTSFLARISDTTAACSYSLNPASLLAYGTETVTFSVTAPSGCAWTAVPSDTSWITTPSGGSGTASGIVTAALAANGSSATRAGSIEVEGKTYAISQAPASCTYAASASGNVPDTGGQAQIAVTAPAGCPWNVQLESPLETLVSGGSGTGNGTVTVSLAANNSVAWLNPVVAVGPQSVALSEANICAYELSPQTLNAQAASGSISVTANRPGCYWAPASNQTWLTVSGSGTGSGSFSYTVQANTGSARSATVTLDHRQFGITQKAGTANASPR